MVEARPPEPDGGAATLRALSAARRNRCPVCGGGPLMTALLTPAEQCSACGTDFRRHAAGDGAIFLVLSALCAVVMAAAVALEFTLRPPLWAHAAIATALTGGLTWLLLPFTKRFMIAQSIVMDARGAADSDVAP